MTGMLNLGLLVSEERELLRRGWAGFVGVGTLLAALGIVGVVFAGVFTYLTVLFIGWAFLISGTAEVIHAVVRKGWSGFWLDLVSGIATAMVGLLIVLHPFGGASILTIFLGAMFLVGGIFRIGVGVAIRNPYAGWFVLHGCVSLLLGVLIVGRGEESARWVIGTLVAVDLLVNGVRLIMFGLAVRRIPGPEADDYRPKTTAPAAE